MSNDLLEKERQVEISRLSHTVLEFELKLLKKQEELLRLEADLQNVKDRLQAKKEGE